MSMICHRCDQRAVIRLWQHRLQLCSEHYIEWFIKYTAQTIERYHMLNQGERIIVAVSGGKDSLAIWDVLQRLGYSADGLYINLGISKDGDYSHHSLQHAQAFACQHNLSLQVVDLIDQYGAGIPELSSRRHRSQKPCSTCGLVKRHIMNEAAQKGDYDALVTGHNLDDEVSVLFSNTLSWDMEMISRQSPVLPAGLGFTRKLKPLCRFSERETTAYALVNGIQYIEEECPFAEGASMLYYKGILNQMEEQQRGLKLRFYSDFLKVRKMGQLPSHNYKDATGGDVTLCPQCGQPTSSGNLCSFCRLMNTP
ncbi:MAG TPA: ATP-binding protein [Longilinea sp.]|nr:ATP-binding protein [Longilinea sp.]